MSDSDENHMLPRTVSGASDASWDGLNDLPDVLESPVYVLSAPTQNSVMVNLRIPEANSTYNVENRISSMSLTGTANTQAENVGSIQSIEKIPVKDLSRPEKVKFTTGNITNFYYVHQSGTQTILGNNYHDMVKQGDSFTGAINNSAAGGKGNSNNVINNGTLDLSKRLLEPAAIELELDERTKQVETRIEEKKKKLDRLEIEVEQELDERTKQAERRIEEKQKDLVRLEKEVEHELDERYRQAEERKEEKQNEINQLEMEVEQAKRRLEIKRQKLEKFEAQLKAEFGE